MHACIQACTHTIVQPIKRIIHERRKRRLLVKQAPINRVTCRRNPHILLSFLVPAYLGAAKCQQRPTYKEKEAYLQGKRDLLAWRKRLVLRVGLQRCINAGVPEVRSVSKETYYKAKETYSYGKRGLFTLAYRIPEVRSVSKETYFAAKEA